MLSSLPLPPQMACLGAGGIGMSVLARLTLLRIPAIALARHHIYFPASSEDNPAANVLAFGSSWPMRQDRRESAVLQSLKVLFITVPAYELAAAITATAPHLSPHTVLISLCNGRCDPLLIQAQRRHPQLHFRLGVAIYNCSPCDAAGPPSWRCSPEAYLRWGPLHEGVTATEQHLATTDSQYAAAVGQRAFFRRSPNIYSSYYKKWIINTTINTLAAAYRIPRADHLLTKALQPHVLTAVFDEAYALAWRLWGPLPFTAKQLYSDMLAMISQLGPVEISMHRHLRLGQPTESHYLAGEAISWPQEFPRLCELHTRIITAAA